jgi:hypothetical protein
MTAKSIARITMLAGALALRGPCICRRAHIHEVYVAAEAGKYAEAQAMMDQVLKAHPNSAKAYLSKPTAGQARPVRRGASFAGQGRAARPRTAQGEPAGRRQAENPDRGRPEDQLFAAAGAPRQ